MKSTDRQGNGKEARSDIRQWHPRYLFLRQLFREISRKEVFQPHLPVRLPCYDLAPITGFALGRPSRLRTSGAPGFHGLTGGVYKARERNVFTAPWLMRDY